jgi:hypothetical protein
LKTKGNNGKVLAFQLADARPEDIELLIGIPVAVCGFRLELVEKLSVILAELPVLLFAATIVQNLETGYGDSPSNEIGTRCERIKFLPHHGNRFLHHIIRICVISDQGQNVNINTILIPKQKPMKPGLFIFITQATFLHFVSLKYKLVLVYLCILIGMLRCFLTK